MSALEREGAYLRAMPADTPPTSPLRHMLWLAWLLSAAYLAAGAVIALVHRLSHGFWLGRLSEAMDLFGGSFLRVVHLWHPLLLAAASGRIGAVEFRLVLIALSVGLIFLYALTVGLLLNGARALLGRAGR